MRRVLVLAFLTLLLLINIPISFAESADWNQYTVYRLNDGKTFQVDVLNKDGIYYSSVSDIAMMTLSDYSEKFPGIIKKGTKQLNSELLSKEFTMFLGEYSPDIVKGYLGAEPIDVYGERLVPLEAYLVLLDAKYKITENGNKKTIVVIPCEETLLDFIESGTSNLDVYQSLFQFSYDDFGHSLNGIQNLEKLADISDPLYDLASIDPTRWWEVLEEGTQIFTYYDISKQRNYKHVLEMLIYQSEEEEKANSIDELNRMIEYINIMNLSTSSISTQMEIYDDLEILFDVDVISQLISENYESLRNSGHGISDIIEAMTSDEVMNIYVKGGYISNSKSEYINKVTQVMDSKATKKIVEDIGKVGTGSLAVLNIVNTVRKHQQVEIENVLMLEDMFLKSNYKNIYEDEFLNAVDDTVTSYKNELEAKLSMLEDTAYNVVKNGEIYGLAELLNIKKFSLLAQLNTVWQVYDFFNFYNQNENQKEINETYNVIAAAEVQNCLVYELSKRKCEINVDDYDEVNLEKLRNAYALTLMSSHVAYNIMERMLYFDLEDAKYEVEKLENTEDREALNYAIAELNKIQDYINNAHEGSENSLELCRRVRALPLPVVSYWETIGFKDLDLGIEESERLKISKSCSEMTLNEIFEHVSKNKYLVDSSIKIGDSRELMLSNLGDPIEIYDYDYFGEDKQEYIFDNVRVTVKNSLVAGFEYDNTEWEIIKYKDYDEIVKNWGEPMNVVYDHDEAELIYIHDGYVITISTYLNEEGTGYPIYYIGVELEGLFNYKLDF